VAGAGVPGAEVAGYMQRVASAVDDGLKACGVQPDAHGTSAANPLFARSVAAWRAAAQSLGENPTRDKALILVSILTDSRPLWGAGDGWGSTIAPGSAHVRAPAPGARGAGPVADALWQERSHPDLQRLLARFALQFRPPTGFLRDFVVEHSGERRGQLDIKHGGLIPIIDLARWAGMAAGAASGSTVERLRVAEAAGTLESTDAHTLIEAFGFIFSLRLDHQVEQLRHGEVPDDFIAPKTLNPLARSYLREAFRAVASVQSGLASELAMGIRWG
jgi:CBS domain-containing protein